MTLIEFEDELRRVGNNTDEVFFYSGLMKGCHFINDVVCQNGMVYLKEDLNCACKVYTCGQLYYLFNNLLLVDKTEVRFVFTDDSNYKELEWKGIVSPFSKESNKVVIEVY